MKAYYIDGVTSKRNDCELNFQEGHIEIVYLDQNGVYHNVLWDVQKIGDIGLKTTSRSIKYGDFPHQVLEFKTENDFNELLKYYHGFDFHKSSYNTFTSFGWMGISSSILGVVVVAALFYIYGAPFLAESVARSIPNEYEEYIGENVCQTYLEYMDVDTLKSVQIQEFYDELNYESEYDIEVVVVNSPIVNAFALPGGYVVVFTGILNIMDDETELAGLLAHEVSHVNERHSLRIMSRELASYLLLASLTGDIGGFSTVLIENSNLISSMSHSRKFEKEADLEGIALMKNAGHNPQGMVSLFEKFQDKSQIDIEALPLDSSVTALVVDSTSVLNQLPWNDISEILSTHPAPRNRIKYLKKEIALDEGNKVLLQNDTLKRLFEQLKE